MPFKRSTLFVLALVPLAIGGGCFTATSEFDGIAGVRPIDSGASQNDTGDETDSGANEPDAVPVGSVFPPVGPVDCKRDVHLLCTSFDVGGGLTQGGWIVEPSNGGESLLDGAQSKSAPASFRSKIPAIATKTNAGGILRQSVRVGKWTALRYSFDMRISACSTTGGSTTLAALQASPATAFGLVIDVDNTYVFAQLVLDQGEFKPHKLKKQPELDRWFRIDTRIELSSKAGRMQVFIDGESVLDIAADPRAPGTDILLNIGANATGPVAACDLNYDNVTFDKE